MEFSWATISFIDIGLLSFGVVAIASGWIVKRQSDKQYNALQQQYSTLQQNFRSFQSTADQRYNTLQIEHNTLHEQYNTLQQENETLRAENADLRTGLDAVTREHKALQAAFDHFRGRYDELTERLIPLFEQLAREKLQGQF